MFFALSLAFPTDPSDPNKPLLTFAARSFPDLAENPHVFLKRYRPDSEYFFDIPDFRGELWFEILYFAYGGYVAKGAFHDEKEFKLKYPLRSEPTLGMNYTAEDGRRIIFMPRTKPMIIFSLRKDAPFDSLLAIHITGGGAALTYACILDPPRQRRH